MPKFGFNRHHRAWLCLHACQDKNLTFGMQNTCILTTLHTFLAGVYCERKKFWDISYMGTRRCRLPTPTAILKLRGSRLAAARSQNELVGTSGNPMPMASADCDEATRKIFAQLLSQLNELRVLTTQDYAALSLLASTLALGEHAAAMAAASGGDVLDTGKANPWAVARRESRHDAFKIMIHFGMTPASRATLQGQKDSGDTKADTIKNLFKFGS